MTKAPASWRIVGLVVAADGVTLEVAVAGVVHEIHVTPAGACLMPCGLVRHPLRDELEAECWEVAAQARLGWVA